MSEQTPDPVMQELQRYEASGEIVRGGAAALHNVMSVGMHGKSTNQIAEAVAKRLELPANARYKNPEHVPPVAPNGGPASELRTILRRYAPERANELTSAWAGDLARLSGPKLAGEVVRRLTPVPMRPSEAAYRDTIETFFNDVPGVDADKLARELLKEFGPRRESDAVRLIAGRLRLSKDDIRRRGKVADVPGRRSLTDARPAAPPKSFPKPGL